MRRLRFWSTFLLITSLIALVSAQQLCQGLSIQGDVMVACGSSRSRLTIRCVCPTTDPFSTNVAICSALNIPLIINAIQWKPGFNTTKGVYTATVPQGNEMVLTASSISDATAGTLPFASSIRLSFDAICKSGSSPNYAASFSAPIRWSDPISTNIQLTQVSFTPSLPVTIRVSSLGERMLSDGRKYQIESDIRYLVPYDQYIPARYSLVIVEEQSDAIVAKPTRCTLSSGSAIDCVFDTIDNFAISKSYLSRLIFASGNARVSIVKSSANPLQFFSLTSTASSTTTPQPTTTTPRPTTPAPTTTRPQTTSSTPRPTTPSPTPTTARPTRPPTTTPSPTATTVRQTTTTVQTQTQTQTTTIVQTTTAVQTETQTPTTEAAETTTQQPESSTAALTTTPTESPIATTTESPQMTTTETQTQTQTQTEPQTTTQATTTASSPTTHTPKQSFTAPPQPTTSKSSTSDPLTIGGKKRPLWIALVGVGILFVILTSVIVVLWLKERRSARYVQMAPSDRQDLELTPTEPTDA